MSDEKAASIASLVGANLGVRLAPPTGEDELRPYMITVPYASRLLDALNRRGRATQSPVLIAPSS